MWISLRALAGVLLLAGCTSGTAPRTAAPGSPTASKSVPTSSTTRSVPSTTPRPTRPAPTTSAPQVRADPVQVFADCRTPSVRPARIVLTCADGGVELTAITWTSWGELTATGTGTLRYNDCTPNCAQGTSHAVPGTTVNLSAPVDVGDGLVLWTRITERPAPPGFAATQSLPTRSV